MGLRGNSMPPIPENLKHYAFEMENRIWHPAKIMGDAQALTATKNRRTGHERELAERLTPYKDVLRRVEMAYEITSYPAIRSHYIQLERMYGITLSEKVFEAGEYPYQDASENPHRAPVVLDTAEMKLFGKLTQERGLPFDPQKREYRYTDVTLMDIHRREPYDPKRNERKLMQWRAAVDRYIKEGKLD